MSVREVGSMGGTGNRGFNVGSGAGFKHSHQEV